MKLPQWTGSGCVTPWRSLLNALGSVPLAQKLLKHWMATGEVRWNCEAWRPRDAKRLARWEESRRELEGWGHVSSAPVTLSVEYFCGDPRFWGDGPEIDWENDCAREKATWGAEALGIKMSRTHLLTLLPQGPAGNEKVDLLPSGDEKVSPLPGRRKKMAPQQRRVLQALKKLFPPHGKVPDDVSTGIVHARVSRELAADSRSRGLAVPSLDTVNRALGRR